MVDRLENHFSKTVHNRSTAQRESRDYIHLEPHSYQHDKAHTAPKVPPLKRINSEGKGLALWTDNKQAEAEKRHYQGWTGGKAMYAKGQSSHNSCQT